MKSGKCCSTGRFKKNADELEDQDENENPVIQDMEEKLWSTISYHGMDENTVK